MAERLIFSKTHTYTSVFKYYTPYIQYIYKTERAVR